MSIRSEIRPYPVILNGDMSGSLTSLVTIIQKISVISYAYSWSGTSPVGTVSVQASNDYSIDSTGNVSNAGTWNTVGFLNTSGSTVTTLAVTGSSGNTRINVPLIGDYAVRTLYTFTSGTGTIQAIICGKVS